MPTITITGKRPGVGGDVPVPAGAFVRLAGTAPRVVPGEDGYVATPAPVVVALAAGVGSVSLDPTWIGLPCKVSERSWSGPDRDWWFVVPAVDTLYHDLVPVDPATLVEDPPLVPAWQEALTLAGEAAVDARAAAEQAALDAESTGEDRVAVVTAAEVVSVDASTVAEAAVQVATDAGAAAQSAADALASKNAAGVSAAAALVSEGVASGAAGVAGGAASDALVSETNAGVSASAAGVSETAAGVSAGDAGVSAGQALAARNVTTAARDDAVQAAADALESELAAEAAATDAGLARTGAETAKGAAETARDLAVDAASAAEESAGDADDARVITEAARDETVVVATIAAWSGAVALTSEYVSKPQMVLATLTGNTTLTLPPGISMNAYTLTLALTQDGAGGRALTIPGVFWPYGVPPVPTPAAGSVDLWHLMWAGVAWIGLVGGAALMVGGGGGV